MSGNQRLISVTINHQRISIRSSNARSSATCERGGGHRQARSDHPFACGIAADTTSRHPRAQQRRESIPGKLTRRKPPGEDPVILMSRQAGRGAIQSAHQQRAWL